MCQQFWDTGSEADTRALVLVADLDTPVIDEDGVMLRHLELDPSINYQGRSRFIL